MIKKVFGIIAVCCIFAIIFTSCTAQKIDSTINSNIVACINNFPIPSYIYNNEAYISVYDLTHYGFNVVIEGNVVTVSVKEDGEIEEDYGEITYYKNDKVGKNGKPVSKSDFKVVVNDVTIDTVSIDNKVYMPFMALKEIADAYANKKDVKKLYFGALKNSAGENEFKYIKLKKNDYENIDFMSLTLNDLTKVYGDDYIRTFEDDFAVIDYNNKVCPLVFYFDFKETDTAQKMLSSKIQKVKYTTSNSLFDGKIKVGMKESELEEIFEDKVNVFEDETGIWARYNYDNKYRINFVFKKTKKEYKVTEMTITY